MTTDHITDNVFVIGNSANAAIVQLTGWRDQSYGDQILYNAKSQKGLIEHVKWGPGDNYPNMMRKLMNSNNMIRSQLTTWRDMIWGSGPRFYTREIVDRKVVAEPYYVPELEEWAEEIDLKRYEIAAINQLPDNGNVFTRFEWDFIKKIPRLSVSDSFHTRIKFPDDQLKGIQEYATNPYFGEMMHFDHLETVAIPKFDPDRLPIDMVQIYHGKEDIPGNPFYSFPSWWAAADWIELANLIPRFHISGIKNGYNIKYLIKVSRDYFGNKKGGKVLSDAEEKEQWGKFESSLRGMLSGEDQVNKSIMIKSPRGMDGKLLESVDVQPLKNEMSDDAYSNILEMANLAVTNSFSLMPTLSGTNPGKGNDSGSQVRVMADYQQHFRTAILREIITDPVNRALRMMGYKNVYRAFDSVQITTLDDNPAGTQKVSIQKEVKK